MTSMPEEVQLSDAELDDLVSSAQAAIAEKRRDPVVSALIITIVAIVVLALLTVAYALLSGVFGSGAPRTMSEKRIMGAYAKVEAGSKLREDWVAYILALTEDGQYRKAQEWIDKGKKTLREQDTYADMTYVQANLDLAQGKLDQALKTADAGLKTIKQKHEEALAEWKKTGNPTAASVGLVDNYWEFLLLKAEVYEKKKDWKNVVKAYDEYLASENTAATVFTQRGIAKEKLGDTAGAEADFRQTLMFIPDSADALAGLERIGVVK